MNYCQTEAYEELLNGMGVRTRRECGVLFRQRRTWGIPRGWDAIGLTDWEAWEFSQNPPSFHGRMLNIPGKHETIGRIMTSHVVDLPLRITGTEMRPVRAGLNRAKNQGVTVRMVKNFTDWCFSAGEYAWPNHQRDVEWQYYGGQHTHFIAEYKGNVIGTLGFHHWDGVATEIMSRSIHREFNVQELLHVESMNYAFDIGCHTFVLGSAGNEGIGSFKAKFRGRAEWITCAKLKWRLDL